MRIFTRPSGKAVVVSGALAITLVVGATSGAVAGKLITSKDIKDGTIAAKDIKTNGVKSRNLAKNSVDWTGELNKRTRERIAALAGKDGLDGAVGPQGPAGPVGATGATGATGAPGGGLVGSAAFTPPYVEGDDFTIIDDGTGPGTPEIYSQLGDDILLPGPGTYLITVQAVFLGSGSLFFDDPGPGGLDFTTDPDAILGFFMRSCSGFIAPMCQVSIPYVVPAGSPAGVPLRVFALGDGSCGCDEFPLQATVNVFLMDQDSFAFKSVRTPRLHGSDARELADQVLKARDRRMSSAR